MKLKYSESVLSFYNQVCVSVSVCGGEEGGRKGKDNISKGIKSVCTVLKASIQIME